MFWHPGRDFPKRSTNLPERAWCGRLVAVSLPVGMMPCSMTPEIESGPTSVMRVQATCWTGVTAYRNGMEPEGLRLIEEDLRRNT